MRIACSVSKLPTQEDSYTARWEGADGGVIACWLRGLEMRKEYPHLATLAQEGTLPLLPWRGGIDKAPKSGKRLGAIQYLAGWHGLRGEDLDIDVSVDHEHVRAHRRTGDFHVIDRKVGRSFSVRGGIGCEQLVHPSSRCFPE
jgi:hypothetical protein